MRRTILGKRIPVVWLMALAAHVMGSPAAGQLNIQWFTVDGGGHTFSTGAGYSLGGTAGQPDAGTISGSTYTLSGGFWLGGVAASYIPDAEDPLEIPEQLRIVAGLVNPFVERTGIRLALPMAVSVEARVFDHSGRLIRDLYRGTMLPGRHLLTWNGLDNLGHRVSSGAYLLHVRTGDLVTKRRVVMLR